MRYSTQVNWVNRCFPFVTVVALMVSVQSAEGQLRSAFGPAIADAKQVVGPQAKITDQVRRVQANVRNTLAILGRGAGITNLSVARVVQIRADGATQVIVWLTAVTNNELGLLTAQGVVVEASEPRYMKAIRSWLTPNEIDAVANLPFVRRVSLPDYAIFNTGSVTSEGDVIHNADDVRNAVGGADGTGVIVGAISDGVDTRAAAVATGDLPLIGVDPARQGSGDEGTAMLEIVYDLAPGATLLFSGPTDSMDMVASINWLAISADVIVDDLTFVLEPFFEDGPVAKAAEDAVTMRERCYISSAGNHARKHHQRTYANVVVNNAATGNVNWDLYDWDGAGDHSLDMTILQNGGTIDVVFQWDDKFGASTNDYDLYLVNAAETAVLFSSLNLQTGTQDPIERICAVNNGAMPVPVKLWIRRFNTPTGPKTMELFDFSGPLLEHMITADSIFGHPAVTEVISTAAVNQTVGTPWVPIEAFSSRGPSTIAFPAAQVRATPFITAVDGVMVTGAGGFPSPFFGTSAAAPHVAAVAALLKSCNPGATPAAIRAWLSAGATDIAPAGFDNDSGHGLLDAEAAVARKKVTVIPAVSNLGLVALLLLTAVAGVIVIRRARRGHAAG